tara:strand:- start:9308 stop:9652 length:345 start_codon:yes stop_codon:yes gene_type:complete
MSSAVKKMEQEAERVSYKNLIKAMSKISGDKPKKVTKKVKAKVDKKVSKNENQNEVPEIDDELRSVIRGFFHKKKIDDEAPSADLYVGNATKKYGKPKPKAKPKPKPKPKKYGR